MGKNSDHADPEWYGSLWVGRFGSRAAVDSYVTPVPVDDPDAESTYPFFEDTTCPFFEDIGLPLGCFHDLEVRYEPDLSERGAAAFAGLSAGSQFASGAMRVVRELGLDPFDTVLMVWWYDHQSYAEPGERVGPVRFVGTFSLLPEPDEAT